MSTEKNFTQGFWKVETRPKKLHPFISNGRFKIAEISNPSGMEKGEANANATLISMSPDLLRNLEVSTLFLEQLVTGVWSPEEIKSKAEALFYTNKLLIKKIR